MSLNFKEAKKGASGNLAPIGNHIARCYQIVDLGTQDNPRYGNTAHKIRFVWELCEEMKDFGKGKPEPYSINMTVNFFVGKNSHLQKLLEGWKGGTFTDAEWENFELKKLVGKACMINVVHATVNDTDYANVASVSPVPAKWKDRVPAMHNPPVYFEVEMGPNSKEYKSLNEYLQKQIDKCHEWKGSSTGLPPEDDADPFADLKEEDEAFEKVENVKKDDDDSDSIPF